MHWVGKSSFHCNAAIWSFWAIFSMSGDIPEGEEERKRVVSRGKMQKFFFCQDWWRSTVGDFLAIYIEI